MEQLLVPLDGSDPSFRALRYATDLAHRYGADLHVVHITDSETDATESILDRARRVLADEDVDADPEVEIDVDLDLRPSARIGRDILDLVEERGYDHVIMGHHGAGAVERAILGSAVETVVRAATVPVTIIP